MTAALLMLAAVGVGAICLAYVLGRDAGREQGRVDAYRRMKRREARREHDR